MIEDNGMQSSGKNEFMRLAYNIRVALTAFFFVVLPWQTRWIYRASPIHQDAEWGRLSLYASELLLGALLVWAIVHVVWLHHLSFRPMSRNPVNGSPLSRGRRLDPGSRGESGMTIVVGVLAILVYGAARSWFTVDPAAGFQHTWWILEAILVVIFLRTGWFPWRAAVAGLFIGLSIAALLGVYQVVGQYAPGSKWLGLAEHRPEWGGSSVVENAGGRFLRAYGSLPHPNILGGYMVLGLLLVILSSAKPSEGSRMHNGNLAGFFGLASLGLRMTGYILTVLLSAAIALSFSRGAWIAWVAALFLAIIEQKERVLTHVLLSVLMMGVVLGVLWPVTITRFDKTARLEVRALEERTVSVTDGIAAWKTAPWFGIGPAQYVNTFYVQHPDTSWWQLAPPHNVGIAILVEYGVVGTLLLSGTLILFGWHFIQKGGYRAALWFLPLLALAQFDHYPWSLYSGVMLVALFVGFHAHIIHTIPTVGTQIRY